MLADVLLPAKVLQVLAVGLIGVYTYRRDMLNAAGAFTATLMGAIIVLFTNVFWLLMLFALLGLGSAVTRFRFSAKQAAKVAEKKGGRRSTRNVIANGLTPAILAALAPGIAERWSPTVAAIAFVSAIAVAAADTFASEFGSLATRVRLITTWRRVPAGVDGGVSWPGQFAALAGGATMAGLGYVLVGVLSPWFSASAPAPQLAWPLLAIPALVGFAGCQIDSLVGATLEGGGLFTKEETNLAAITFGGAAGLALAVIIGT